jgi:hypothetical protein
MSTSPPTNQTTATKRLFDILVKARSSYQGHHLIKDCWAELLGIKKNDIRQLFIGLTSLLELVDQTEEAINKTELRNKNLYLRCLPPIRSALSYWNLEGQWNVIQSYLGQNVLQDLEHCVEAVWNFNLEEKFSEEEIKKVVEEVDDAFKSIEAATLDLEVKRVVLEMLENTRRLLMDCRIRGGAALREALTQAIGNLITVRNSMTEETHWKKVIKVIVGLDNVYSRVTKYAPLLKPIMPLLLNDSTGHNIASVAHK